MTGVQYTALAYAFATVVLLGYAATLFRRLRATRRAGKGEGS
jgi:hypothetical protein